MAQPGAALMGVQERHSISKKAAKDRALHEEDKMACSAKLNTMVSLKKDDGREETSPENQKAESPRDHFAIKHYAEHK